MITMIIFKTARADFSLVAAGLAGLFFKPHGGENAHINSSTTLSTRFPFSKSWGAFWLHVFSIFVKIGCFFYGCWAGRSCGARAFLPGRLGCCGSPGAPAAHGLSFLVVWAAAARRALLRCTGFPFWSFGLLRLVGRSCVQQENFPSI